MPAKSKAQQKLFATALSVKRGERPRSDVSDEVLDIVDNTSEKDIKDYAKTSTRELPTRVKQEEMDALKQGELEEDRDYKGEYENYQSKPKQKKRRAQRNTARGKMERMGKAKKGDGKDVHHRNRKTSDNSAGNLATISKSKNRSINDMKLTKNELRTLIKEELQKLNEVGPISFDDLDQKEQKTIQSITKILNVGNVDSIWDGHNGKIVEFKNSKQTDEYKFTIGELKKIVKLPIHWIWSDDEYVTIEC